MRLSPLLKTAAVISRQQREKDAFEASKQSLGVNGAGKPIGFGLCSCAFAVRDTCAVDAAQSVPGTVRPRVAQCPVT